jgi:threonine/homoserine/homoserine lactone efflux protein
VIVFLVVLAAVLLLCVSFAATTDDAEKALRWMHITIGISFLGFLVTLVHLLAVTS